jgi:hypothetical protein
MQLPFLILCAMLRNSRSYLAFSSKRGMVLPAMFNYIRVFRAFQDLMLMSFV